MRWNFALRNVHNTTAVGNALVPAVQERFDFLVGHGPPSVIATQGFGIDVRVANAGPERKLALARRY